jgi:hypothetical protein
MLAQAAGLIAQRPLVMLHSDAYDRRMTITVAWVRQNKNTSELLVAADSRLRACGPMDQAQKLFRLDRGDCCLGFCGDAQVAYPLFIQVGTTLNNFVRTRTRAEDVTEVTDIIGRVLNNLIDSCALPETEKAEQLTATKILFAGWSWKHRRFDIGFFMAEGSKFTFHHRRMPLPHPWREKHRSLVFIGDYEREYRTALHDILERRHGSQAKQVETVKDVNFDYEPIEALNLLLQRASVGDDLPLIGGAPQLVKVYPHGNDLPIAIRTGADDHFLFGRRLFHWEKTSYPILNLTGQTPLIHYPMAAIPLPAALLHGIEVRNDGIGAAATAIIENEGGN